MADGALLFLALPVSVAGMACFALSTGAHWRQIAGDRPHYPPVRFWARPVGALLLIASFLICTLADPVPMAALVWPMLLTFAAVFVALALTVHASSIRGGSGRR